VATATHPAIQPGKTRTDYRSTNVPVQTATPSFAPGAGGSHPRFGGQVPHPARASRAGLPSHATLKSEREYVHALRAAEVAARPPAARLNSPQAAAPAKAHLPSAGPAGPRPPMTQSLLVLVLASCAAVGWLEDFLSLSELMTGWPGFTDAIRVLLS